MNDNTVLKLRSISETIASNYLRINAKLELLEPLLGEVSILEKFDRCIGTRGLNLLRETMLLDIAKDLVAIAFDKDHRAASLTNAFRMFNCAEIRTIIQEEFVQPNDITWVESDICEDLKVRLRREVQTQQRQEKLRIFEQLSNGICERFAASLTTSVAVGLKDLRDKAIAHFQINSKDGVYSVFKASDMNLKWGDPRRFATDIESFVFDLEMLVSGKSYALDLFKVSHREIGDDFWRRTQGTG